MTTAALALLALLGTSATGLSAPEAPPEAAAPMEAELPTDQHATVRLVAEHTALVPGTTAMLGLVFEIIPRWHIYWDGRNDTGQPPGAVFTLPEGYVAEPWQWPVPKRHVAAGEILDHIYEDRVTIIVPVKVPADAKPGSTVKLSAKVNWLVCNDLCVPENDKVELTLKVTDPGTTPSKTPEAPLLETTRKRLPKPLAKDSPIKVGVEATGATIDAPGSKSLAFMPLRDSSPLSDVLKDGEKKAEHLKLRFDRKAKAPRRLYGVLEVRTAEKDSAYYLIDAREPGAELAPGKDSKDTEGTPAAPASPKK